MEHEEFENINPEMPPKNEEEINKLRNNHDINPPPHEQEQNPLREEQRGENLEEQDRNAKILTELGSLRCLSSNLKEGDNLQYSLGKTLDTIIATNGNAQGALYNITSFREERRRYYVIELSYKDVKNLKIKKDLMYALFREPNTSLVPPINITKISIDWCVEPSIKKN